MISAIRRALRITHGKLDREIENNIYACKEDMLRVGILFDADKPLHRKCCELYCKAEFNFNSEAERYRFAYEELRNALSISCGGENNDE